MHARPEHAGSNDFVAKRGIIETALFQDYVVLTYVQSKVILHWVTKRAASCTGTMTELGPTIQCESTKSLKLLCHVNWQSILVLRPVSSLTR